MGDFVFGALFVDFSEGDFTPEGEKNSIHFSNVLLSNGMATMKFPFKGSGTAKGLVDALALKSGDKVEVVASLSEGKNGTPKIIVRDLRIAKKAV